MAVVTARGDLTGAKFHARQDDKIELDRATRETRNALTSELCDLVSIPGGRTYAIPREVCRFLAGDEDA